MPVTVFQQVMYNVLEWVKEKIRLDFTAKQLGSSVNSIAVRRGEIYECQLGYNIGAEKNDKRPVLIVQNDQGNTYAATTIIVPLTSQSPKKLPTHFILYKNDLPGLAKDSVVQCEKIREIDKVRLGRKITSVPGSKMKLIDEKIKKAVGLT